MNVTLKKLRTKSVKCFVQEDSGKLSERIRRTTQNLIASGKRSEFLTESGIISIKPVTEVLGREALRAMKMSDIRNIIRKTLE